MAQLKRAIGNDHHLFIMAGPSKGTRQITETGIDWLKIQGYSFPLSGGSVKLNLGDYRHLENHGYLYIKEEDYTRSPAQPLDLQLIPPETVNYGAPLLLQLTDNHHITNDDAEWVLILKVDEWEENARDALLQKHAAAVGCYVPPETGASIFSSVSLQHILNADYWPEVAPQKNDYTLYWQDSELYRQNSQSSYPLKEATPPAGLKVGWQGNVFFRFNSNGLTNTWKRYLPGMSISATTLNEFYWLAQSGQQPEPAWPGKAQRVGQVNRDWQLWHLQTVWETNLEDVVDWFSYRQIRLIYPTWRLRLLNPLSIIAEHEYTCVPGQRLLVRCDPPTQQTEDGQASAFLSLTPYSKGTTPQRQLSGSLAQSQNLMSDPENTEHYLRAPAPPTNQAYRISISGGARGQSLWVQTAPLSTKPPAWLHGLHCSVVIAGKQHIIKAFIDEPIAKPYSYQLSVHENFSLEQLERATWSYQPSGIPCLLSWEYLSSQGKRCQEKTASISTDSALTNWWQTYVWPTVAESPWVKLTFDAASFGNINLRLVLKSTPVPEQELRSVSALPTASEQKLTNTANSSEIQKSERSLVSIANQAWWANPHYTANFFWLCGMAEQEITQVQQVISLELSQALEQLCVPGMPARLKNALILLATSRSMPVWIYLRLQVLLVDLHSTSELVVEESW
jgi:hypothetical protein